MPEDPTLDQLNRAIRECAVKSPTALDYQSRHPRWSGAYRCMIPSIHVREVIAAADRRAASSVWRQFLDLLHERFVF